MKISRKTDYALRALFTLVDSHGKGPIPIRELARRNDVPKPFLEHIMLEMKRRGWVRSLPGRKGGYRLARPPATISMGEVIRHFDGLTSPIHCVSTSEYRPCTQEPLCRFRRVFLEIRNETARRLERTSLAEGHGGQAVAHNEVFDEVLLQGAGI